MPAPRIKANVRPVQDHYARAVDRPELSTEELRGVQLTVLSEFDRLCRQHRLTYYVTYGTLLGAIRHGGYIPWDDDVDVMMPRADYDRLTATFAVAPPLHLRLDSPATRPGWPFPYAKISDDRTEVFEPLAEPLPLGVNLDVFPLDPVPEGPLVRMLQARVLHLLLWAVELRYIATERGRGWHRPASLAVVKPLLHLVPARLLVAAVTRLARVGGRGAGWVGVRVGSYDWSVPAAALGTPQEITFDDLQLLGPADPHAVLTAMYGDYRQLPPVPERVSHHAFIAVWR